MSFFKEPDFRPECSPGFLLRVIQQRALGRLDALFADEGLTASQWIAMVAIHFGKDMICAALARDIAHDKGAMTRMIDAMEAKGWVARRRDRDDRRLVILSLTDDGVAVVQRCKRKVVAQWNAWLADWEAAEIEQFMNQLRRLRATMEAGA